jgi:hypothetical protein
LPASGRRVAHRLDIGGINRRLRHDLSPKYTSQIVLL